MWYRYAEQGERTEGIEQWPAIPQFLQRYMEAFVQLTPMRLSDQGTPQRLQYAQIFDWLSLKGIDDYETVEDFVYYISALDDEYLKYAYSRIEADRKVMSSSSKRGKR